MWYIPRNEAWTEQRITGSRSSRGTDMAASDYERAVAYLKARNIPEDVWLVGGGQQWYKVSEVAPQLGVSTDVVRTLAERGAIPGAVLHGQQTGWRLPHSGLVLYLARLRQEQEDRQARERAGGAE
jgi:hypothetical protein